MLEYKVLFYFTLSLKIFIMLQLAVNMEIHQKVESGTVVSVTSRKVDCSVDLLSDEFDADSWSRINKHKYTNCTVLFVHVSICIQRKRADKTPLETGFYRQKVQSGHHSYFSPPCTVFVFSLHLSLSFFSCIPRLPPLSSLCTGE